MYISLVCHTEPDSVNKYGKSFELGRDKQTFKHLNILHKVIDVPVTYSLGVGGRIGERLLRYYQNKSILGESGIHIHYEKYDNKNNMWAPPKNCSLEENEFKSILGSWKKIIKSTPKSCVFGHWFVNKHYIELLEKNKIYIDLSFTHHKQYILPKEKYIVKGPFMIGNVLEIPTICDSKSSLNPFVYTLHRKIILKLIRDYKDKEILLNIGFHSYDLFRFKKGNPVLKKEGILFLKKLGKIEILTAEKIQSKFNEKEINHEDIKKINIPPHWILEHKIRMGIKEVKRYAETLYKCLYKR